MAIDTDKLRELAQAMGKQEWLLVDANEGMHPPRPLWEVCNDAFLNPSGDDDEFAVEITVLYGCKEIAEYIVETQPSSILALLDELDRLRKIEKIWNARGEAHLKDGHE